MISFSLVGGCGKCLKRDHGVGPRVANCMTSLRSVSQTKAKSQGQCTRNEGGGVPYHHIVIVVVLR